jgi:hypothetical protein
MITAMKSGRGSYRDFNWFFSLVAEVSNSYEVRGREFQLTH